MGTTVAVAIVVAFYVFSGVEDAVQLVKADITVEEIINQVETERRRPPSLAGSFTPALVGEKLIAGDGVKTHPQSEARIDITFSNTSRITRTTPNTIWRLGNFGVTDDTIIELEMGKIFLLENTSIGEAQPIKIVTPAGIASPRGTWLSVQYNPIDGVIEVQCFRSICELENQFGKQIMTDEEKSAATAVTAPTRPVVMTKNELIDFARLPKAQSGEIAIPPVLVAPIRTVSESIPAERLVTEATAKQAPLPAPAAFETFLEPTPTPRPALATFATLAPKPATPAVPPPTPARLPTATPPPPSPVGMAS